MVAMRRSTAIGHLVEMAYVATARASGAQALPWPLEELWVTGQLLEPVEAVEHGSVVLVLDLPADELTWLAAPPAAEWIAHALRLGRRPVGWSYRPSTWPVWNHELRRLVRFWSAAGGTDLAVIDALRSCTFGELPVLEASPEQLARWLPEELAAARRHLGAVLDGYRDDGWRSPHGGGGNQPEEHLWRAAKALAELFDAVHGAA
jgi:hypothetical protein